MDAHELKDVPAYNERSLSKLSRAIALSQGQFSLILVRCNYTPLRQQILHRLREQCPVPIREIVVSSSRKTLHETLQEEIGDRVPPSGLMVLGLEWVKNLEHLRTKEERDRFLKDFHFPLVMWVTTEGIQNLARCAADFKSVAPPTIKFELTTDELIAFLERTAESLFTQLLDTSPDGVENGNALPCNLEPYQRLEIESAQRDLRDRGVELSPELAACLEFIRGLDDRAAYQIDAAIAHYQQSLVLWQAQDPRKAQSSLFTFPASYFPAVVLFHIGLCYCQKAREAPQENRSHWEEARRYLKECIDRLEDAQQPELLAKFITHFGEVLERLEAWEALQAIAKRGLTLHRQYGNRRDLARDYGFLAEVALQQHRGSEAKRLAEQAIDTLNRTMPPDRGRGLYLFLLARSYAAIALDSEAVRYLELARDATAPQDEPHLYVQLLKQLRSLYFKKGEYLDAFKTKLEQRQIEYQYGLRAFIGAQSLQAQRRVGQLEAKVAQEIEASGRQGDIQRLITERITRNDRRLTVIYGPSGVGKSSILRAGLVPVLRQNTIGDRTALPIVVQNYTDWVTNLAKELVQAIEETAELSHQTSEFLLEQLRYNSDRHLQTVLIFDQFEEFFFVCPETEQRQQFFEFLRDCLNLPYITVILSLREDYRHYLYYLLEWNQIANISGTNNDILNGILRDDIRYYLGNFSPQEAESVMKELTQRGGFAIASDLVEILVRNLAGESGEVRPIELQIVGSQLQAEGITTLEKYATLGENPKEKLIERYLESVVEDCGTPNQDAAWKVLVELTNEKGTRPLRTQEELASALQSQEDEMNRNSTKLNLILEILVGSGLVFRLQEEPEKRYQLVHDYLVEPIRKTYDFDRETQLKTAQEDKKKAEAAKKRSEAQLNQLLKQRLLEARFAGIFMGLIAVILALIAAINYTNIQIKSLSEASKALQESNLEFDALIESLRAGKALKTWLGSWVPSDTQIQVRTSLQQVVYEVKERNRLEGHRNTVSSVSFSPDSRTLASASADGTVKLWSRQGQEIATLPHYESTPWGVSFSPDGQLVASSAENGIVKLWSRDGTLLRTLKGHTDIVYQVSFSPNSELVASPSQDKTIKLWSRNGVLLHTLRGHIDGVRNVSFSPDGNTIASASLDNTIKLWSSEGKLLRTLTGHQEDVLDISFSPNSQIIASASKDKTIKIWSLDGQLLKTLEGHDDSVHSVNFSPIESIIASASKDKTIKIWSLDGQLLHTLKGHIFTVYSVIFSPDGDLIASASDDNTVKLWRTKSIQTDVLDRHEDLVRSVSFSPNGKLIATASFDGKIKLWHQDGTFWKILTGHTDAVRQVSFSPDGQTIASASKDKTVRLWSIDGTPILTLKGHADELRSVSFSPDGQTIASASKDKTVKLWSIDGTPILTLKGHGDLVTSVSFSPDGQTIASVSKDKTVKLWSLGGQLLHTLEGHNAWVMNVSFSPDGQTIASASVDRTIKLWSIDGKLLKTIKGHSDSVFDASFSPDGQTIASASKDNTVKLWNRNGILLTTLRGHEKEVWDVSFSPDGNRLASASSDYKVILWNFDLDDLLVKGCDWVRDYLENNSTLKQRDRHLCDDIGAQK